MPSKTETQTVQNTSEPYAGQKPYVEKVFSEAQKLYDSPGPSYFPQSTVTGFAPEQLESFGSGAQHARNAAGFNADVLAGNYMQNPNDDAVFRNIESKVLPSVGSQFSGSGRFGSNLQADSAARGLTDSYAPYAAAQWQQGLDRRTAAANNYAPYSMLEGIGQQRQQLGQAELQDAMNRYNFEQDLPSNKLRELSGFVGGSYGQNTSSTTPYQTPSIWSQLGGGVLGGLGLLL